MEAGRAVSDGNNWAGGSFATVLSGCLSIGLFFGWASFGNAENDLVFGVLASDDFLHRMLIRVSAGIVFLVLSLKHIPLARTSQRLRVWLSVALAVASATIRLCSVSLGDWLLIPGAVLAGFSLALFLHAWLVRFRSDVGGMLAMLLFATSIGNFSYAVACDLGIYVSRIAALALPVLAGFLILRVGGEACLTSETSCKQAGRDRLSFVLQAMSLLLCNFASGPASYGEQAGMELNGQIRAAVTFALAALFTLCGYPRGEILFALLAFGTCLCTAPMLMVEGELSWLVGLRSAGFWVIMMYSVAWFTVEGKTCDGGLAPMNLRGLAAVYILCGVAEVLGTLLPGDAACVIALVAVGLALAIALVDATRTSGAVALQRSTADDVSTSLALPLSDTLRVLADRAGLTEGERRVFECLSRGYSLKQVAQQLGTTEGAAKFHRHNVYQKFGITSREELIELVERAARE